MPDLAALLQSILDRPLISGEPIAIAVSGGPDSLALLDLAHDAWPGRITALTVDHALRPASAAEAAGVAGQCAARAIPHVTLTWTGEKPGSDLQAAARDARYRLMADWCAGHATRLLLTAHHADDQAETLLMRLARGSGSTGLSGIRPTRRLSNTVVLARPLLTVRRQALAEIARAGGWRPITDPSNDNPRFARTHARRLLAATPWLDPARMAQSAAHLAEAEAALQWTEDRAWAGNAVATATSVTLDAANLPTALVHRLVRRALLHLAPTAELRGPEITTLINRLTNAEPTTLANIRAIPKTNLWLFTPAPPRR
ncbi:hypothetical protein GCM10011529_13820 [Polymorphobacter glacialis]|uniref:tRNA(Ile)-lysidine synthase n=1 Tax=Sandarakinorhabdus glacialis TaxID=1614636 RepID=A0A916ZQ31_9SPHN|nr:tRNA lysidine(34) synthetase TilS [Polymorphobacter glacialis]GGE08619.1 hypothetical protein GCM10011529_13820 [Polymorphobacter glacialis]